MFKKPSHYFLQFSFQWKAIFKILNIPKNEHKNFKLSSKYKDTLIDHLHVDEPYICFEYYVQPNSIWNGSHGYSSVYDQQVGRFGMDLTVDYGCVLKHATNSLLDINFSFKEKVGKSHSVLFVSNNNIEDTGSNIAFIIENKYFNFKDARNSWGNIPYKIYDVDFPQLQISKESVFIGISLDSGMDEKNLCWTSQTEGLLGATI